MAKEVKILFLTLHTFSLTGGIEKVCRIFSKVLQDLSSEKYGTYKFSKILSLCDHPNDVDEAYCPKKYFSAFRYRKTAFGMVAIYNSLKSDILILSHINLIPIAYFLRLFSKRKRIILFAHGIEVWRDLTDWKVNFLKKHVEIWAVSQFTKQVLQQKHKIDSHNIKVLNNCLDPYFDPPQDFKKPDYLLERFEVRKEQPVILTISRISSHELYKGYDLIISCIPKILIHFPDLVYILAGKADETEHARLTQLIKENGMENHVIFASFIPNNELVDFFLLADVFVMPSKKEGFGMVFIEAAACGCRVIAGNQDGSKDALLNGQLGVLINAHSISELVNAIHQSLDDRKDQSANSAQQQKCLAHFSYEHYLKKVGLLLNN